MSFYESNGLLSRIPGEYIARASRKLPLPRAGQSPELRAEIEDPHVGRVRIKYRLMRSEHQHAPLFWAASFAEVAG